jgi:hypothetical protein
MTAGTQIMKKLNGLLLSLVAVAGISSGAVAESFRTEANVMVEISFQSEKTHADPFNEVTLDAVFIDPNGRELRVPAFWDGGKTWKARYASPVAGTQPFHTECSDTNDKGLNGIRGKVEVRPYTGQNPLLRHGPLKVAANKRYLEYNDGSPFFWLGDTWWMGLSHRLHWPEDVQKLATDRKEKEFTVIQIVAGLYPDMFPFDKRGANEAGYPWETNYTGINPKYFDAADQRLEYLVDQGLTPCIVGAWGYFMPWMGVEKMKQHWRYLIARYGALPVVWCAAGEANLPWYLAKGFPYDDRKQVKDWTEVMQYMRDTDPFHRLITVHPTGIGRLSARHTCDELGLLDIDMLQTPHGQREAVPVAINTVRESYADNPVMPVIDGEASYEMLSDSLPTEWTRRMFWICMMNGAAGHTYGANGIWQVNRPNDPHGPSPYSSSGVGYGRISWEDAMNLPGSAQVAMGKKLLLEYPWQDFQPHPEWAAFVNKPAMSMEACSWIWFPEGDPTKDAPAEKRYFRREFVMPEGKAIQSARLRASADNQFVAFLNGKKVGASDPNNGESWKTARQFENVIGKLQPGTNVLAIEAENVASPGPNPAGMIAHLEIKFKNGESLELVSDGQWRVAKKPADGWDKTGFDGSGWEKAIVAVKYGGDPWGKLDVPSGDALQGPQSAGIPGVVRIIYVPDAGTVEVRNLGRQAEYAVSWFDPVKGTKTKMPEAKADEDGAWICAPPTQVSHDWVLILEEKRPMIKKSGKTAMMLRSDELNWALDWSEGELRSLDFDNGLSGHRFAISKDQELALNFSAAVDRVAEPFTRVADFRVRDVQQVDSGHAVFNLESPSLKIDVALHLKIEGATRRKWAEVTNKTGKELLLLDVDLDDFRTDGAAGGGGEGEPVFVEREVFAAVEHPAGVNEGKGGRIHLAYYPGKRLGPGETYKTHVALVSVAKTEQAQEHFVEYIQSKSLRPKHDVSVYTPFGINNQWGGCPTGDDQEVLNVLDELHRWQKDGMKFDYFSLDTGWIDPNSDLTRFRPTCYPNGPDEMIHQAGAYGMKFGLWFATSWAAESCWDYPQVLAGQPQISMPYRLGYPEKAKEGRMFCFAAQPYFDTFKKAILYHVKEDHVRLLKFDGGYYRCDSTEHGHLPGKYSTAAMYDDLIDIASSARAIAPDIFIMWYWGLKSPFWAMYGDLVFESGLQMEGSATSVYPTLYYRDSVTLAQDQNAQFAKNIPPIVKDSLGVWLADNRWGNFMGKERWREALVMDLGRGDMFFPNIWGNAYHLTDDDVEFMGRMTAVEKENAPLFLERKNILGDPMRNEVYGYAHCKGDRGYLFLSNDSFVSRRAEVKLDESIGLDAKAGTSLHVVSKFPETARVVRADGVRYKAGDTMGIWLRPFEVLMLEVGPSVREAGLPLREVEFQQAQAMGMELPLKSAALEGRLDARFSDAARFEGQGFKKKSYSFETELPELDGDQPVLAVAVRLRKGEAEWKHAPTVVEIAQALVRIGDEDVQMIPVPDGRQFGNTQSFGSSWVVYKVRLNRRWAHKPVKLAVHAYLPEGVEAEIEAWVTKMWWKEDARPKSDGYYNDAPS